MDSPLVSAGPDRYARRRHLRRSDVNPIDPRWYLVLTLHMTNTPVQEICEITGYADSTIYSILSDERVIGMRQQILHHTGQEFENLYPKVVKSITDGLDCTDIKVRLDAADKWLKAHGKYKGDGESKVVNVTAENVVMQILQDARMEQDSNGR